MTFDESDGSGHILIDQCKRGSLKMQSRRIRGRCITAACLLTALTTRGVSADTARPEEVSLLGVRLMANFSDVMRKFGQPNEIQVGEPTVSGTGQTVGAGPRMGGMMGGPGGMMGGPGMMMRGGGGSMPGPMMRSGGSSMPGIMMGGSGSSFPGGGMPGGMMGSGGGSSFPGGGMSGYQGMAGRGLPGMGGRQGGPGGSGGFPGMSVATGGAGESTETTWWYNFPQKGLHYSFLFNKEGHVIQIQAYGEKPDAKIVAPRTARGITLGSDLGAVIRKYGWSNDGETTGDYVLMRYGKRDRIAFQTIHNKVLGIVLGRVNPQTTYIGNASYSGMGGPGGYRGMGMGAGYPGGAGRFPGGNSGGGSSE